MLSLHTFLQIVFLTALLRTVLASPAFEKLPGVPGGWAFLRTALDEEDIKLRLSLKQQNVDEFYDLLMEVSTPDHPRYGMHYEGHELRSLLKPKMETSDAAIGWLRGNGVGDIEDDGDYILMRTNVSTANKLLETTFNWYQNPQGRSILRTLSYSIPADLQDHINFVQPTTRFGTLAALVSIEHSSGTEPELSRRESLGSSGSASDVNATCAQSITPQCLFDIYNVHYKADANNGNTVAHANFLDEAARHDDLEIFLKEFAPYAVGQNFSTVSFNGGVTEQNLTTRSAEANFDNQYVVAVGYPTPVTQLVTGGRGPLIVDGISPDPNDNTNEPFLEFLLALLKLPNKDIPNSISISNGEREQEIPPSYAIQVCQLFAQLGARGKSVMTSSGDSGAGDYCLSNDGFNITKLQPEFPSVCPYVTSVGGTFENRPERATVWSGGGFSNIFRRPAYQDLAVSTYLEMIGSKNHGLYNTSGAAVPDVAAQSAYYNFIFRGRKRKFRGTSCSTPVFNGLVALLNSARISSGLPTLGFMNPWIYSQAREAFNDITLGRSEGCTGFRQFTGEPDGGPNITGVEWPALPGWDAVTGHGTPDFGKLLALSSPGVPNTGRGS